MIYLILSLLLFLLGGFLRGLFECILLFDSLVSWFGIYYSYSLFVESKDRDKSGKINFMESNFPNDGGHRIKLFELISYSIGAVLFGCFTKSIELNFFNGLLFAILIWWIISVGFLISFNKYRHEKH